jgi:hypothetical protein
MSRLQVGECRPVDVFARSPRNDTGITLEREAVYDFAATGTWIDLTINCSADGYSPETLPFLRSLPLRLYGFAKRVRGALARRGPHQFAERHLYLRFSPFLRYVRASPGSLLRGCGRSVQLAHNERRVLDIGALDTSRRAENWPAAHAVRNPHRHACPWRERGAAGFEPRMLLTYDPSGLRA